MCRSVGTAHVRGAKICQVARPGTAAAAAVTEKLRQHLHDTSGLLPRILAQTRARVLKGSTSYPDKALSLVELHTEAIRKGKGLIVRHFRTGN